MFGKIIYLTDNIAHIEIPEGTPVAQNLMNMHVMFEDEKKMILGEVEDIDKKVVKVRFLGEVINGKFIPGVIRKPTLQAQLRVINRDEVGLIVGEGRFRFGHNPQSRKPPHADQIGRASCRERVSSPV